jgi:hypothetical protein
VALVESSFTLGLRHYTARGWSTQAALSATQSLQYSIGFYFETALMSLDSALKRKEYISARLGSVLSELYLLSCAMENFEDDLPRG